MPIRRSATAWSLSGWDSYGSAYGRPAPGIRRKVKNVFGSIPKAAGATTEVAPVFFKTANPASSAGVSLAAALRAATRFVDRNRHRLQRRLDQAQRYAHVMEPALQFVFHRSPLG